MKKLNPAQHPVEMEETSCPLCGELSPRGEPLKIENPVLRLEEGFCPLEKLEYSLCRRDGLIFMNYRPAKKTLDWYYQNSPQLANRCSRKISSSNRQRIRWLEENLNLDTGDRVVDLGTNDGNFLYALKKAGYEPAGIEPSRAAVKRLNNYYEGLEIYGGTVGENFDVLARLNPRLISMIHLFEHLAKPLELLRSLASTVQSRLFLELPNGSGKLYPRITREHGHLYYYDQNTLAAAMNTAGYKIEKIEPAAHKRTLRAIARPGVKKTVKLTPPDEKKQKLWQKTKTRIEEENIKIKNKTAEWKERIRKQNLQVGLYGAGTDCFKWLGRLEEVQGNISAIFDRTPHFQGEQLLGIPIMPPEKNKIKKLDWLIITPRGQEEKIARELPAATTRATKIKFL